MKVNILGTYQWGHEETMIDWIAIQFPKMLKTFEKVGCLL